MTKKALLAILHPIYYNRSNVLRISAPYGYKKAKN